MQVKFSLFELQNLIIGDLLDCNVKTDVING